MFFDYLSSLEIMLHKNIIFLGDFNIPSFTASTPIGLKHKSLLNLVEFLGLKQCNTILNCNDRLLDLVFSNLSINPIHNDSPLLAEDPYHPTLAFDIQAPSSPVLNFPVNNAESSQFNFRKVDYPRLYELILHSDWSPVIDSSDVTDTCFAFYEILNNNFAICVPLKSPRKRRFPQWFTKKIINNVFKKEKVRRRLQVHKSAADLEKFRYLRSQIKSQSQLAYRVYWECRVQH